MFEHQPPDMSFFFGSVELCGFFFQKTTKFHFLSEMSENDTDIETVQSISVISESMQVIFHSSDSVSKWLLGTEVESYQEFRRSNIENSRNI